ncbi:PDZ domain-containing protein [Lacibacter cauensis]|uniref:PDZ domain-containing protein n=1 Tax=Lacibacter cauensis TaxID=510947 RepID=A0A562SQD2_9BACT|nr:M28 family peptidase [Lacibacter cauensis]TWI83006.1 PDZ domain-containing protein [Lacibacter cauensis]
MKNVVVVSIAFFVFTISNAQKLNKADKISLENLRSHVSYLASDQLEGRRTGTKGEELAYVYISQQFEKNGLTAKGEKGFLQPFEVNEGKQVLPSSFFIIDGEHLKAEIDFFPLAWSANGSMEAVAAASLHESGSAWFWDIKELLSDNEKNPHFDLVNAIRTKEKDAVQKGATALIIYNSGTKDAGLKYDGKDRSALSTIPVIVLQQRIAAKLAADPSHMMDIKLKVEQGDKIRKGHNVVAYIDNNAATTIIIGAHYDHLGYGEDNNSRHTGEKAIHNGADDNASGTAALLELSRLLKLKGEKTINYLFIAFSGEELGLYGSKYFTDHPTISFNNVNYMINMDMVGRFSDSSKTITIGGIGTSPAWGTLINEKKPAFNIKVDSSGTGPSDHTSFYRKDLPVLFFFTGLHTDYHKPSDDFDKINYVGQLQIVKYITRLISRTEKEPKLAFTKTREQQTTTSARFTVSMGIMPDYTFSGAGVKVDGVSAGRAAEKAGIKTGDIVVKLGEFAISSVESYMQTLSKFKKGDATKVKVKRGDKELEFDIAF